MSKIHWSKSLVTIHACFEAVTWCKTQESLSVAWAACDRGDWMLWLLGRLDASAPWSDGRKPLVACALECAATSLEFVQDNNSRQKIVGFSRVIAAWTRGEASVEEARIAQKELWGAAYAYASASSAAYASSASSAAYAAYAAYASDAADAADARKQALRRCAEIVRRHFPVPPVLR